MREYPSIRASTGQQFREFTAHVFEKIDGSNLRVEWTRKRGWEKFGTRTRLFDETDPDFGVAVGIFRRDWEDRLTQVAKAERWNHLTAFLEFWGVSSFSGKHDPADPKHLTLFDVCPEKKELLGPKEFLDLFGAEGTPAFFGIHRWTRGFVEGVRKGEFQVGIFGEGVVGKGGRGQDLVMAKAKTQAWIDRVLSQYGAVEGGKLLNS